MERVALGLLLIFWTGLTSQAQTLATLPAPILDKVAPEFSAGLAPSATNWLAIGSSDGSTNSVADRTFASERDFPGFPPASARSSPETAPPCPLPLFGSNYRDARWELAIGLDLLWFRSSVFRATAVGTKTSVAYFRSNWIGVEGVASTAFAPQIYAKEHVKLFTYGAGPKIVWRRAKWDPWMHAILGGAREFPQTVAGGKNGLGIELGGGGADYHLPAHLSGRLEGDYVLTRFFSQTQSNFQSAVSVVFDF